MPEQDLICRSYNNIWSIPSDTHMHLNKETGERYITGHMVGITDKWNRFVVSSNWGAVNFRTTGCWSLCDFLQANGLKGEYSVLNGDTVYKITSIDTVCNSETPCMCPGTCCTSESRIPQPVAQLVTNGDVMKLKECYHDKYNLYDVCNALNENIYIKGDMWTVVDDKVMCPIGNKIYIL
jgi:hypothetical protein